MRLARRLGSLLPLALLATPGCVAEGATARGITLDDPLGLVMDVAHAGHPLRVFVLPASSYACNAGTGAITPDVSDSDTPGMTPDAVVDISADVSGDMASAMAMIPTGDWTVLVRGKGVDSVSGSRDVIIATGCATVNGLAANETREVGITLLPVHANGRCSDGVLSPDEQCEPPGSTLCDATCHTTPMMVNTRATGGQAHADMSTTTGQRIAVTFDSEGSVGIRLLDQNGGMVGGTGSSLARDETIDTLTMPIPQIQGGGHPAVAADGHFAIAFGDFGPAQSDVLVQFFTADRAPTATTNVLATPTGTQAEASAAYAGNGALMVVYQNDASATGISGTVFAAGSTTAGMSGFAIGTGTTGATHPVVAGLAAGFVVAFSAAGDIRFQRFAADGTAMDAAPLSALDAADAADAQDEPAIAASADGTFAIAWTEHNVALGDGMGTSIRARAFTAAGVGSGSALVLPSTGAAGDQSQPSIAAADGRYFVSWSSSGSVHARVMSGTSTPLPNREQPQTTNDFIVAASAAEPAVVAMGSMPASWLVGYESGNNIFVRRYPR